MIELPIPPIPYKPPGDVAFWREARLRWIDAIIKELEQ